eukprot:GHRR01001042.1.p1 GENE.GHRR01001042.1~~GHRR01001042.1.p1  ORF type:complete len:340 (+),score=76.03 GHRR01001042.1:2485-3504(+)
MCLGANRDQQMQLVALLMLVPWCSAVAPLLAEHPNVKRTELTNPAVVRLPNGTKPEGVSSAGQMGFYTASLDGRVLYVGSDQVATRVATEQGVPITSVKYDASNHIIYAAGSISGKAFMYILVAGSPIMVGQRVELGLDGGYINDAVVGVDNVYFSDSTQPFVYSIPRMRRQQAKTGQQVQQPPIMQHFLGVEFTCATGLECANGLVEATPGVLIIAHYLQGDLYRYVLKAKQLTKLPLPHLDGKRAFPDGLLMTNQSTLWVCDNFNHRILQVEVNKDYSFATVKCVVTSSYFNTPTTMTVQGSKLWAVNAHFLDCLFFKPCLRQCYEIVGMELKQVCV